jgi:hypothetical protein
VLVTLLHQIAGISDILIRQPVRQIPPKTGISGRSEKYLQPDLWHLTRLGSLAQRCCSILRMVQACPGDDNVVGQRSGDVGQAVQAHRHSVSHTVKQYG